MELTQENYYTPEADAEYMSVHQYQSFVGTLGKRGCEAKAMAKLNGEYTEETTDAMLIGSYVDSYFEGTLPQFKKDHPELFTQKGELYAKYKRADRMIAAIERQPKLMQYLSGEKQRIFTGELFGCKWKAKLDSYIPHIAIVDLKTTANLHKSWRVEDYGWASFVEYWGYITQLAVYQELVRQETGERLPCYIVAVTKEDTPETELIGIDQESLNHALNEVEMNMSSILSVKDGTYEPTRCERCDYCISTKVIEKAIKYTELIWGDE